MQKLILFCGCWLLSLTSLCAQELDFKVSVITPKLQTADPKVFQSLETALREFLNNQKWTDDVYETNERIRGSIVLTIKEEISPTSFTADMAIQAVRPVYGSNYETPLFTHLDKEVSFNYELLQPLTFSRNNYVDNLTAVLGFYAYLIIGLDYDSFSPLGGDPYFQISQDILNSVPAGSAKGWSGGRSRYDIIENYLNPRSKNFRQSMYDYHRLGMDVMAQNADIGKKAIDKTMDKAVELTQSCPTCMILQIFSNTKGNELIEIFKQADRAQKTKVYQTMSRIDPANAPKYKQMGI